jgi:hypothetical protein
MVNNGIVWNALVLLALLVQQLIVAAVGAVVANKIECTKISFLRSELFLKMWPFLWENVATKLQYTDWLAFSDLYAGVCCVLCARARILFCFVCNYGVNISTV